jgi:F-type H+-transporting ATPase subunit a
MSGIEGGHATSWSVGWLFNTESDFFILNAKTLIDTWIVMGIILAFCIIGLILLKCSSGTAHHAMLMVANAADQFCTQALGFFSPKHISFIATFFIFILLCNLAPLIPGMEEPTTDLNTTLALGLIAFLYTQYESIKKYGIIAYIKGYFQPFILLLPLNIIGKFATVVSMSFRLFGNIFGGALITKIYAGAISKWWLLQLICFACGLNLLITGFFTVFEGTLQAFVFTMLTVTNLGLALQGEGH